MNKYLKLNLGCGQNHIAGFINVDKYGNPEMFCDLENFPWPWEDSSAEEILLVHVLEHLGEKTDVYINIMKELYRICRHNAVVRITVPHPRHDDFINDPTHVRIITPEGLKLFSKKENIEWAKNSYANSPLGLYHNIDFDIIEMIYDLDEPWHSKYRNKELTDTEIIQAVRQFNNVVKQIRLTLRVIKVI